MTDDMWMSMIHQKTKTARKKQLLFLFKKERMKKNKKMKREKKKETNVEKKHLDMYLLSRLKSRSKVYLKQQEYRSILYGSPFIVDMRYLDLMTRRENSSALAQLLMFLKINCSHADPFKLVFCNAKQEHNTVQKMQEGLGLQKCVSASYSELYPKDKLVYLSPHSKNVLEKFNHDDIYIMAAFVDKTDTQNLTTEIAEADKLRTAAFPLLKYCG